MIGNNSDTVIAKITVPADAFMLGSVFRDFPDAVIELEPIIPLQSEWERKTLLVWVSTSEPDAVETSLTETDDTEFVDILTTIEERILFEIEWSDDIDGIVQPLFNARGRCLKAIGTADEWEFHLLFNSHQSLSEFNIAVTEHDIPVTLLKLQNSAFQQPVTESSTNEITISPNHKETLLMAYQNGYFANPRDHRLDELAKKDNVSDSAFSKRLRRATASLIEHTLLSEGTDTNLEK